MPELREEQYQAFLAWLDNQYGKGTSERKQFLRAQLAGDNPYLQHFLKYASSATIPKEWAVAVTPSGDRLMPGWKAEIGEFASLAPPSAVVKPGLPNVIFLGETAIPIQYNTYEGFFTYTSEDEEGNKIERYYRLVYPVLPFENTSYFSLAEGFKNIYAVDSETGALIQATPLSQEQLEKHKLDLTDYSKGVSYATLRRKFEDWGITDVDIATFPDIRDRLESWADALAEGRMTDEFGNIVPNKDDMGTVMSRIKTFMPGVEELSNLGFTMGRTGAQFWDKLYRVREQWANDLQKGTIDFPEQSPYTRQVAQLMDEAGLRESSQKFIQTQSAIAKSAIYPSFLFETAPIEGEVSAVAMPSEIKKFIAQPEGLTKLEETISKATETAKQMAGQRGLAKEFTMTQQLIKEETTRAVGHLVGAETAGAAETVEAQRRELERKRREKEWSALLEQARISSGRPERVFKV